MLGCATGSGGASADVVEDGVYEFQTRTGRQGDLRGRMTLVGDQISLQPDEGTCRLDTQLPSIERVRYLCDNNSEVEQLTIVVDRRNPTRRSSWAGVVTQTRTRTVCDQYANQNGRRVCVRSREERQEVRTPVGGPLTFLRRAAG